MRKSTNFNTTGSDAVFLFSGFICILYIVLRVLLAGGGVFSPQTVFINGLALLGFTFAVLSRLMSNGLILPSRLFILALGAGVLATGIILLRAWFGGYIFSAEVLAGNWLADLFIFLAVMLTARERTAFRIYVSSLGAMLGVTGVYALYQKVFALEYLRDIALNSAAFREDISLKGVTVAQAFIERIEDGWVDGGFGSEAALCAFSLAVVILILGLRKNRNYEFSFDPALLLGLLGVTLSRSTYGIILGKIFEIAVLYRMIMLKQSRPKDLLLVVGGAGMLTIMGLIFSLAVWLAAGSIPALLILAVCWYFEVEFLSLRYSSDQVKPGEYLVGTGVIVLLILLGAVVLISPAESELGYIRTAVYYNLLDLSFSVKSAWAAFTDMPLFGWGLDNYIEVAPPKSVSSDNAQIFLKHSTATRGRRMILIAKCTSRGRSAPPLARALSGDAKISLRR